MNILRKITGFLLAIGIFSLILTPPVFAQSVLDDIKAKLESEGISVIDYSSPESQWGSLSGGWISFLSGAGYSGIEDLAADLEDDFKNITEIKRELRISEAEKSGLTIDSEIEKKDDEITLRSIALKAAEDDAKNSIRSIISGAPENLNKEAGINLIFHEVDFYFNYSKWGGLPLRIIAILEDGGYLSLQDLVDIEGVENIETALTGTTGLSADDISLITDSVQILSATGESQLNQVTRAVANTIKNLIAGLAVIWIIYAGARMVFAQGDENTITEQKRSIIYAVIGLASILLIDRGINYLYGPAGVTRTTLTPDQGFTNEVYGIVNFIEAIIGVIAILFIIVSGVRTLFATGEEDVLTKQKKSLLWVGVGLILIAIDKIIIQNIFIIPSQEQSDQIRTSNITSVINTIGGVIQFILGFVGLIAFGVLIYGAATMIMNFGNDEMVEKSKKIIRNAIIGIVVIISAYVIVATLVVFR
ncbi:pilin [Patescibacteria group bacterium]|nr:pilin [Patescibacteria group bacterium]MBU1015626.1 pilin [Patescibacteria group bacterium]MBU1684997.1 pilin [Patescibacteria group bacterium]MBU1938539.1 pilin [Patescibacteria group bacterium]